MHISFSLITQCLVSGVKYIPVTLVLAFVPVLFGIIVGTLIALSRIFKIPILDKFFGIAIPFYNGIPVMVTILLYNLVYLICFKPTEHGSFYVAMLCLILRVTSLMAETIRGAFLAIPKGQYEACYSCGLSVFQSLKRIIIPQVIPVALPSLTNNIVGAIKNTSLVLAVGIVDVLNGAIIPCAETYSYVEGYIAAAIIYWGLCALVEFLLNCLEKKFNNKKLEVKKI